MNFGWDLTAPGERATALHEIGHALGPAARAPEPLRRHHWDDEAVYADLAGPPNFWPPRQDVPTSSQARPRRGQRLRLGPGLRSWSIPSAGADPRSRSSTGRGTPAGDPLRDRREFVPPLVPAAGPATPRLLVPFRSVPLGLGAGGQADFGSRRRRPATTPWAPSARATRCSCCSRRSTGSRATYRRGRRRAAGQRLRVGSLLKGRRYVVRVRLHSAWGSGQTAVMCW